MAKTLRFIGTASRYIVAALFLIGLCLAARPAAAQSGKTCTWMGTDEYTRNWSSSQNWACLGGGSPDASSAVIIAGGVKVPYLDGNVTIGTLLISSELDFGAKLTVAGGWSATGGTLFHGNGILSGAGTILTPGTVTASITFDGDVTIMPFATLRNEPGPWGTITSLGNFYNQGSMRSDSGDPEDSVFIMKGQNFVNTGTVAVDEFYFQRGGGLYTYVSGGGQWTNDVDLRIVEDTKVKPTGAVTFKTNAFTVGGSGYTGGNVLELSSAEVTFDGSSGAVLVSNLESIVGDYAVNTIGTVEVGGPLGSHFNAPLHVRSGITSGWGTFNGTITVDFGGTLRVRGAPAGSLIANSIVSNSGTIDTTVDTDQFVMHGQRFINNANAVVDVGEFHFQDTDSEMFLEGAGMWSNDVNLHVDGDTRLVLANSLFMNVKTFSVWGVDLVPDRSHLDVQGYTLTLIGPGRFQTGSSARVIGSGAIHTRGQMTVDTKSAAIFTPTLQIQPGSGVPPADNKTTLYGRFDGPVQVREEAVLALAEDSEVFINNNLSVSGTMDAAANSLLTISGQTIQMDGTFRSASLTTFQAAAQQTINGSGTMEATHLVIETPLGVKLGVPLKVSNILKLMGDIFATDPGVVTLTNEAITQGDGDVWGKVTRSGPLALEQAYSFGNQDVQVTFTGLPVSTKAPASMSVVLTAGAPSGLGGAIRWYRVTAVGGANYVATLRVRYRDGEVVPAAKEDFLKLWRRVTPGGSWETMPGADHDAGSNWFEQRDLISFSDWAIGAHALFLPGVMR